MAEQQTEACSTNTGTGTSLTAIALAIGAGLLRLVPHPPNFTPVGGMSLLAGGRIRGWRAFLLPLAVLFTTDALLGIMKDQDYFAHPLVIAVYGSYMLNVAIGCWLCRAGALWRIPLASLLGSIQFHLITNFAQWLLMGYDPSSSAAVLLGQYPRTLAGLAQCYAMALPFFGRTLLADLLYSGVLFVVHDLLAEMRTSQEAVAESHQA